MGAVVHIGLQTIGVVSESTGLQQLGGIYSKMAQVSSINDPGSSAYDTCQQYHPVETESRLHVYLQQCNLPINHSLQLLATGSIGAVYRYILPDDTVIVIKVQYVGIEQLLSNDLRMINGLVHTNDLLTGQSVADRVVQQIGELTKNELDYGQELQHHEFIYSLFLSTDTILISQPIPSMCTSTILVSHYLSGHTISPIYRRCEYGGNSEYIPAHQPV